jgi:integrase
VAVDPDPVSGERRRLSRTVYGTRSEAKDALQRMVAHAGGGLRTVANRLGHARTSTTLDVYWRFVPARDRDAADHLEVLLSSGPLG